MGLRGTRCSPTSTTRIPALAYYSASWNIEYATCAKLFNYPDTAGIAGAELQPEVAESMPVVSNGDKTYTFTVRKGFRFSPPSGAPVTATTFKKVIERDLSKKMNSPAQSFAGDILGAKEYTDGTASEVKGVVVNGDKISITLVKPAADFLSRIAMPFFCAVPDNTPLNANGVVAPAAAGPYYIKSRTPNRQIVLARNPNYGGDRKASLDSMIFTVGEPATASLLDVKSDKIDWIADGLPPTAHQELARDYGAGSQAAKDGKQRYFVNPSLSFRYLALNTSRPLFSNLKLRQAVNYAINRPALLAQRGAFAGTPTDQYLPPGVPGYVDANIYPLNGPDLKKAKELAGNINAKAIMYTCDQSPCPETAAIVKENLKADRDRRRGAPVRPRDPVLEGGHEGRAVRHRVRGLAGRLPGPVRLPQRPARRPDDPGRQQRQLLLPERPGRERQARCGRGDDRLRPGRRLREAGRGARSRRVAARRLGRRQRPRLLLEQRRLHPASRGVRHRHRDDVQEQERRTVTRGGRPTTGRHELWLGRCERGLDPTPRRWPRDDASIVGAAG